jgi:hypothetical protein
MERLRRKRAKIQSKEIADGKRVWKYPRMILPWNPVNNWTIKDAKWKYLTWLYSYHYFTYPVRWWFWNKWMNKNIRPLRYIFSK